MKKILTLLALTIATSSFYARITYARISLPLHEDIFDNRQMPFNSHQGEDRLGTTMAMNIQYQPVKTVRETLSQVLGYNLKFFNLWQREGEAHITVITPVEYFDHIRNFVSINQIEAIARQMRIQDSEIRVLGLGRGRALIENQPQETYFIIVDSPNLLKIRQRVYQEYVRNGGPESAWNPNEFYPHITVGFSFMDLHTSHGVIKDVQNSLDRRFGFYLAK